MSTLKDFEVIKALGSGSFSSVYKVKRKSDGEEYAMKKVKMFQLKPKEKDNALNEVRILASISDPNIVGYKEAFIDESTQTLCIVMEYAGGGDLLNKITSLKKSGDYFPEEAVWSYLIQMTKGLRTLHNMKILHRDLKCANVFLSANQSSVKIGDLNVSKVAKKGLVYTQTGTPYYASPEVWRDEPYDGKSDIWSLGCVLYEMVTHKPPFRANDMDGLYRKVQKGIFDKIPSRYSSELAGVITSCLSVNPTLRPSCDQLLSNPAVAKRDSEGGKAQPSSGRNNVNSVNKSHELLQTIKMPRNIKSLGGILPKPNYNSMKVNQSFDLQSSNRDQQEGGDLKRSNSSHSRRLSVDGGRAQHPSEIQAINGKKQPVRGVSLDPDLPRPKAAEPTIVNHRSNPRNPIPSSSPNPKPTKVVVQNNHPPLYRKLSGKENREASPYIRAANNILKAGSNQNILQENVQKPPTPGQQARGRQVGQNANPFVDQERKRSLLSKITSNNVLRSLDINSGADPKVNPKTRVADSSPARNNSQGKIPGRYYVPQQKSSKVEDSKPIVVQNNKAKVQKTGNTPKKISKPVWMI